MNQHCDVLVLGVGCTAGFLLPLLERGQISCKATTRDGRGGTIAFTWDPESEDLEQYSALPSAKTVVISFVIGGKGLSRRLVEGYEAKTGATPRWIQLGSSDIFNAAPTLKRGSPDMLSNTIDRRSPYDTDDPRAIAEDELLAIRANSVVLNLAGLWGGARDPRNGPARVVKDKQAVKNKGSLHLIHALDVARAIRAVHLTKTLARPASVDNVASTMKKAAGKKLGQRYILTDLCSYDWWEVLLSWGMSTTVGSPSTPPYADWVLELMHETNQPVLPRSPAALGRRLDSRDFWVEFGLVPSQRRPGPLSSWSLDLRPVRFVRPLPTELIRRIVGLVRIDYVLHKHRLSKVDSTFAALRCVSRDVKAALEKAHSAYHTALCDHYAHKIMRWVRDKGNDASVRLELRKLCGSPLLAARSGTFPFLLKHQRDGNVVRRILDAHPRVQSLLLQVKRGADLYYGLEPIQGCLRLPDHIIVKIQQPTELGWTMVDVSTALGFNLPSRIDIGVIDAHGALASCQGGVGLDLDRYPPAWRQVRQICIRNFDIASRHARYFPPTPTGESTEWLRRCSNRRELEPSNLRELELIDNRFAAGALSELRLKEYASLVTLHIISCGLSSADLLDLDLGAFPQLTHLSLENNNIVSVAHTRLPKTLLTLQLSHNPLDDIGAAFPAGLKRLDLDHTFTPSSGTAFEAFFRWFTTSSVGLEELHLCACAVDDIRLKRLRAGMHPSLRLMDSRLNPISDEGWQRSGILDSNSLETILLDPGPSRNLFRGRFIVE